MSYLLAIAERAVKTMAQVLIGMFLADEWLSIFDVDWKGSLGVALMAGLLSVLSSVASSGFGNDGPSLTTETVVEN